MSISSNLRQAILACAIGLLTGGSMAANAQGLGGTVAPRVESEQLRKGPSEQETREYFSDREVIDQDGQKLRFYSDVLKDKTVLINFVFTTCQDACPIQTAKMVQVKNAVTERFGKDVFFVSISVDPLNDTPQALKQFAVEKKADHAGWRFLTGKPENIFHIIKQLGQYTEDRDMHATGMLLGNVKTRHWVMINPIIPNIGLSLQLEQFADEG